MKIYIEHAKSIGIGLNDEVSLGINDLQDVENSSCLSINLNNVLDSVEFNARFEVVKLAISKLRYNGILNIDGVDIICLSNYILGHLINLEQANSYLLSNVSLDSIYNMSTKIKLLNMGIEETGLDGFYYKIKARRKTPDDNLV